MVLSKSTSRPCAYETLWGVAVPTVLLLAWLWFVLINHLRVEWSLIRNTTTDGRCRGCVYTCFGES